MTVLDSWPASDLQATPEEVLEAMADALCTNAVCERTRPRYSKLDKPEEIPAVALDALYTLSPPYFPCGSKPVNPGGTMRPPGQCAYCGRVLGPNLVLIGWRPCHVGYLGRPNGPVRPGARAAALPRGTRHPQQRTGVTDHGSAPRRRSAPRARDQLKLVLATDAELRELVLRAYLARPAIGFEHSADLHILGHPGSAEVRRLQDYADANHLQPSPPGLGLTKGYLGVDLLDRRSVVRPAPAGKTAGEATTRC